MSPNGVLASASTRSNQAIREEMSSWVTSLHPNEKESFLLRLLEEGSAPIEMEPRSRFARYQAERKTVAESRRRTVGELLAAAKEQVETRRRGESKEAARDKARQGRLAVAARKRHLNALTGRESELWAEVESLAETGLSKNYDLALRHLVDLRDLVARQSMNSAFEKRLIALGRTHARKRSWIARLRQVDV